MGERHRGIIRVWKDEKGFGFITPAGSGADLFFHVTSISNTARRDLVGQRVTYEVQPGRDGKPSAVDVRLAVAGDAQSRVARRKPYRGGIGSGLAWVFSLAFLGLVAAVSLRYGRALSPLAPWIPVGYFLMSAFTYATYRRDKRCALEGFWRVPESTLHFLELIGGWPGALIAQWTLPHKNRKLSYQVVFWFIVACHVFALAVFVHRYIMGPQPLPLSGPSVVVEFVR